METQNENRYVVYVYGTSEMTDNPNFREDDNVFYLTEGRWLTEEDNRSSSPVCVIREEFAKIRGFSVGDTLSLTFRDADSSYFREYIFATRIDGVVALDKI